jgi:hypothetical protein
MSNTPESVLKRIEKFERRESFQRLLSAIEAGRMSHEERVKILSKIMSQLATGEITRTEARKLTKAIKL